MWTGLGKGTREYRWGEGKGVSNSRRYSGGGCGAAAAAVVVRSIHQLCSHCLSAAGRVPLCCLRRVIDNSKVEQSRRSTTTVESTRVELS